MGRTDPIVASHGCTSAVLMVQGTADAEAICQKNSLSVTDVFRPFTTVDATFTLSTVGEPYRLNRFMLRFVHTGEFRELGTEGAEQNLTRLLGAYDCSDELREAEKRDLKPYHGPAPPLPPLRSSSTVWIDNFREQLASSLRHSEGASLDHPVGCILVASAAQPKPVAVFNALLSSANLTPVIADGVADPSLPRTYILLHDASNPAADAAAAQQALAEISRAFGAPACHLIPINSRTTADPLPLDIWSAAKPSASLPSPGGAPPAGLPSDAPISQSDVARLREVVEGPMVKQVRAQSATALPPPLCLRRASHMPACMPASPRAAQAQRRVCPVPHPHPVPALTLLCSSHALRLCAAGHRVPSEPRDRPLLDR